MSAVFQVHWPLTDPSSRSATLRRSWNEITFLFNQHQLDSSASSLVVFCFLVTTVGIAGNTQWVSYPTLLFSPTPLPLYLSFSLTFATPLLRFLLFPRFGWSLWSPTGTRIRSGCFRTFSCPRIVFSCCHLTFAFGLLTVISSNWCYNIVHLI